MLILLNCLVAALSSGYTRFLEFDHIGHKVSTVLSIRMSVIYVGAPHDTYFITDYKPVIYYRYLEDSLILTNEN